jgi:hypothetical protein
MKYLHWYTKVGMKVIQLQIFADKYVILHI